MLSAVTLARFSMSFQYSAIGAMGAVLITEFDLSLAQLGLLVSLFTLPAIVMALPGGAISQRFGDIRPGAIAIALMILGACVGATATSYGMLLIGRTLAGIGAILITIVSGTILSRWFAGQALARAMSVSMFSWPLGLGLALAVIPAVAELWGVRQAFLVMAGSGLVPFGLYVWLWLAEARPPGSAATRRPIGLSRLRDLKRAEFWLVFIAGALWLTFNGSFILLLSFGPVHVQGGAVSVIEAGLIMSAALVANGLATLFAGRIAELVGNVLGLMVASSALLAGAIATFVVVGPSPPVLIVAGIASGLPVPPVMAMIVSAFPDARRNLSMGFFYMVFYTSLSFTPPLAGALGDVTGSTATPLWVAVAMALIAIAVLPSFFRLRTGVAAQHA